MRVVFFRLCAFLPASILVCAIIFEAGTGFFLSHPWFAPPRAMPFLRALYEGKCRSVVQIDPATSRYDPELTYTLRPGEFVFSNPEFRTHYRVNSLGTRDDEDNLKAPQMVVIGDSYAMGWGVEQEEAFPQVLARMTGLKVLNAAVSSYGTVREMRILDRIDRSRLKFLVLQFNENDYEENLVFYRKGVLDGYPQEDVARLAQDYLRSLRYYPGKYLVFLSGYIKMKMQPAVPQPDISSDMREQVPLVIHALMYAGEAKLDGVTLVVLGNYEFTCAWKEIVSKGDYPEFIKRAIPVNMFDGFTKVHVLPLDTHLNAKGYRLIAENIVNSLRMEGVFLK